MTLELQAVASAMGARWEGPPLAAAGWSVDTRTQNAGDVYFALRGPNHDGHNFLEAAVHKGAAALVVEQAPADAAGRFLVVPDTLSALQNAAAWARLQWG